MRPEYDAIIIGSGPSGATIARELSRQNNNVLVLERGSDAPLTESLMGFASIIKATSVGDKLKTITASTAGGTSALYFAEADFPPLDIFRSYGIDLSSALEQVKQELPINELPDSILSAQTKTVCKSAMQLGHKWTKRSMIIDQSKCASGYSYSSKWNARSFLQNAVSSGATVLNRATALRVLIDNGKAVGVEYGVGKSRKQQAVKVYGKKIIVAAGSMVSPLFLRNNGIPNIGNRGFYCNPSFAMFGLVPGLKGDASFPGTMGSSLNEEVVFGDGNVSPVLYRAIMLGRGKLLRLFSYKKSIGVGVVVKDSMSGELREDGSYHKQFTADEESKISDAEQVAKNIIENAGGRHVFNGGLGAAHVGGLVRINEHITDKLETEITNLYVCDGSIIPEDVRLSPTVTLVCLGKYLAAHLSASLKK